MKTPRWLLVLAVAVGLIAAGCGDDGENGGDGGDALSKEEFVERANQICADGNAELEQAAGQTFGGEQPTPQELDAFTADTLVPNIRGQIEEIRDLGIPEGDEDTVNGFLDQGETVLDELEADPSKLDREGNPFAEVNDELNAYGLTTCAES